MPSLKGVLLLKRLRRAIAKVRLILSTNATRWLLIRSASGTHRLSFRDRQGLLEFSNSPRTSSNVSEYFDAASSPSFDYSRSPSPGLPQRQLSRTISSTWASIVLNRNLSGLSSGSPIVIPRMSADESPTASTGNMSRAESSLSSSGDEDVDMKADEFINNFRNRLAMERKVSLELRYVRKNSSGSSDSP